MSFVNTASYPIDLGDGRVLAPGEAVTKADFDPKDAHNKRQLDEARLVEVEGAPTKKEKSE